MTEGAFKEETFKAELTTFRDKVKAPAVIGAVTDAEGTLAVEVIGDRSREDPTPATVDDVWHIGSCGKSITAVLYARLVEAGRAAWGTPIAELFDDVAGIDPGWGDPTIDDLLRCRAGVRPNPSLPEMLRGHKATNPVAEQRSEAAANELAKPPKNPGEFNYSNLGYAIAGAAIDRLAEMPFEAALSHYVFEPLGMTSVGFGPPPILRGHHPRVRVGLLAGLGKVAEPGAKKPADNPPLHTPAGRLHLSIEDWAKFQRIFLNDGAPLISHESQEHLLFDPGAGGKGRSMSMGWASGSELGVDYAMQGSNTMWSATAAMDRSRGRTALVIATDGRTSVLIGSAHLAKKLLDLTV